MGLVVGVRELAWEYGNLSSSDPPSLPPSLRIGSIDMNLVQI